MADRLRTHRLAELSRTQVAALAPTATVIIPVGATEQHGPDLPLGTDAITVEAAISAALAALGSGAELGAEVVVAPTLPYGQSEHHLFACAASLTPTTYAAVLADLFASLTTSGFRRVFVINGHGGNDQLIRVGVAAAAVAHDGLFGAASYWDFADPADTPDIRHIPGHAGAFESSLLMHARHELFADGSVPSSRPEPGKEPASIAGRVTVARSGDWVASGGFTDDPSAGSADAGAAHLERIAAGLAAALTTFIKTPLGHRRDHRVMIPGS